MKNFLYTFHLVVILAFVAMQSSHADDVSQGWTWTVACPESGSSLELPFTTSTSGGFSGSGKCKRTTTKFSKFVFDSSAGGSLHQSTVFGIHTGEVLIMPPVLTTETKPVFLVDSGCPLSDKSLNWIFSQWSPTERHTLTSFNTMGTASYSTSTGVTVTNVYDVAGTSMFSGSIGLAGTCSSGAYTLAGVGDRGGTIYFATNGAGNMKAASGKATLFLPAYTITAGTDLGSMVVPGIYFDSTAYSGSVQVRVTTNAAGTTWTVEPYSDPEAGTINTAYSDSISITNVNSPQNGMMRGTLTRTGTGAGTGKIACISSKGVATRVVCSIESPSDNTIPMSLAFSLEGPHVLGQPSGTSFVALEKGLRYPKTPTVVGGKLIVADTDNNRVLIWNTIPTADHTGADVVLGQPNLASNLANNGGLSAKALTAPTCTHATGTKLFVADAQNHRVLIWNTIPTSSQVSADVVLGQPNMTSNTLNNGGRSGKSLNNPTAVYSDGTKLFVTDTDNHRLLIWNTIPTSNQVSANVVLGQPDTTAGTRNNGGISGKTLGFPAAVYSDGTKLYVSDAFNHRVLIWNTIPTTNQVTADIVLGQPNTTSGTENNGGINGKSLGNPRNIHKEGTKLLVVDTNNNRILIWNTIPTVTQTSANLVLGQPNTTSITANNGGIAAKTLSIPYGIHSDGTKLYVGDSGNGRVLIWNTIPTVTQTSANVALGQANLTSNGSNNIGVSGAYFSSPAAVAVSGTKLFLADYYNNRVLIWNTIPTSNQISADVVLGQPDMTSNTYNNGGPNGKSLASPRSVFSDGTKLFVADTENNRILIWNTIPTASYTSANVVLGQADTVSNAANTPSITGKTLYAPVAVYTNGTKLFVADLYNNRVLIWNTIPTVTNTSANVVLGQPNTTTNTVNNGGITGRSLYEPYAITTTGTKLFVADATNHRVLIWNTIPTANYITANVVLGQPNLTSATDNNGGVSGKTLYSPSGIHTDGTRLFVSDTTNSRVLVWNTIPTANQVSASIVLGQPNTTSSTENNGGMTSKTLYYPFGLTYTGTRLIVADQWNNRLISFDVP